MGMGIVVVAFVWDRYFETGTGMGCYYPTGLDPLLSLIQMVKNKCFCKTSVMLNRALQTWSGFLAASNEFVSPRRTSKSILSDDCFTNISMRTPKKSDSSGNAVLQWLQHIESIKLKCTQISLQIKHFCMTQNSPHNPWAQTLLHLANGMLLLYQGLPTPSKMHIFTR